MRSYPQDKQTLITTGTKGEEMFKTSQVDRHYGFSYKNRELYIFYGKHVLSCYLLAKRLRKPFKFYLKCNNRDLEQSIYELTHNCVDINWFMGIKIKGIKHGY